MIRLYYGNPFNPKIKILLKDSMIYDINQMIYAIRPSTIFNDKQEALSFIKEYIQKTGYKITIKENEFADSIPKTK